MSSSVLALQNRFPEACFSQIGGGRLEFDREECDHSIIARFKKMVERNPIRPAVKAMDRELTFRQLHSLSNQLARALIEERGRAAEAVGVIARHGWPAIVAMLGTLKAGKYVARLDPRDSAERLAHVLDDSQVRVIVTDVDSRSSATKLGESRMPILEIDDRLASRPDFLPGFEIRPDALCAIDYAWGSTGKPTRMVHTHRSVLQSAQTYGDEFQITPGDRWCWVNFAGFTATTPDMLCPLLHGASIALWDIERDGVDQLADWVDDSGVTVWNGMPRFFLGQDLGMDSARSMPRTHPPAGCGQARASIC